MTTTTTTTASTKMIRLGDEHREVLHTLRHQTEAWLRGKGLEQYNTPRAAEAPAHIDRLLDARRFYGLVDGDAVVAVGALTEPDMDFWTAEEAKEPAKYLARFMVAEHGHQYGEQLLDRIVAKLYSETNVFYLRLDCWRTNYDLHRYYERYGFRHVRTAKAPGRMSGALFELDVLKRGDELGLGEPLAVTHA
jgi:hypothetical protein